ncbi:hypothetical protein DRP05_10210 [Archaeoglobales archaeon]|nr:MAG: hypothetical protein DRP05_10210 [Archaeoglobales archaeon]
MSRIIAEILDVLAESDKPMSSQEITDELRFRGIKLESRTIRYHLTKMEKMGLITRVANGKRAITKKGLEELRRKSVFERLGEFSERIEYNVYFCTFDLYSMKGTIPTNVAILDKKHFEKALQVLQEVGNSKILISNLVVFGDENENMGGIDIPKGKFGVGVVSNTIYDVVMRSAGVSMVAEFAGLLHYEMHKPQGFTELISYSGTTLSPGWLLINSGLTSVYKTVKSGNGDVITAIRSFSKYAVEVVKEELSLAKARGIDGIIAIAHPSDRSFSLPAGNRARLIVSAGLNYLAPLHECNLKPELRINEAFIEIREFKPLDRV